MEREGDGDTNCNWCTQKIPKGLIKRLEDLEIKGQVKTSIIKIRPEYWEES